MRWRGLPAWILTSLVLASCGGGPPQLMPMETLFRVELGTLEDQLDLFQRHEASTPERSRFVYFNGLVLLSDGNARKIMEFTSYGDLLSLYYNPETNPVPSLQGGSAAAGAPGQVKNRRAFVYPFNALGELALSDDNRLYVEDQVPPERRSFDAQLGAVFQSRILRFDAQGRFLDFLGQEGVGGTPFPSLEHLAVGRAGELAVIARAGTGWAYWWFDAKGSPLVRGVLPYDGVPAPEGTAKGSLAQLESVFADPGSRTLAVKVDYYQETQDATTRTASGIQVAQSRLWTFDTTAKTYVRSYAIPVLKRQRAKTDPSDPVGDRPYALIGLSGAGLGFFLSAPEAGKRRFLVCRTDGSPLLERDIELGGLDTLFAQYGVTREGTLLGFLSEGNRAQVAWWRSDKLLGTYAVSGL